MIKKIIILLLLVCLFLTACSSDSKSGNKYQRVYDEFPIYTITHYEDFLLCNKDAVPESFVHWNDVSNLGDFEYFERVNGFAKYRYSIDQLGSSFMLEIDHAAPPADADAVIVEKDPDTVDMYRITTGGKAIIQRCGMNYYYEDGTLDSVFWYVDGIKFTISSYNGLACFTEDGLSPVLVEKLKIVIVRLLSPDDAVANAAFAEITEKLSK